MLRKLYLKFFTYQITLLHELDVNVNEEASPES